MSVVWCCCKDFLSLGKGSTSKIQYIYVILSSLSHLAYFDPLKVGCLTSQEVCDQTIALWKAKLLDEARRRCDAEEKISQKVKIDEEGK